MSLRHDTSVVTQRCIVCIVAPIKKIKPPNPIGQGKVILKKSACFSYIEN